MALSEVKQNLQFANMRRTVLYKSCLSFDLYCGSVFEIAGLKLARLLKAFPGSSRILQNRKLRKLGRPSAVSLPDQSRPGATPCRFPIQCALDRLSWACPFSQRYFAEKQAATIEDKYDEFLRFGALDYAFVSALSKMYA